MKKLRIKNLELRIMGIVAFLLITHNSSPITLIHAQTTVDVNKYINTEYAPISSASVNPLLQQKLETEVNRMIIDTNADGKFDHLAPFIVIQGISTNFGYPIGGLRSDTQYARPGVGPATFWINPAETLYVLSYAYPYLTLTTQTKVKAFLSEELKNYNPLNYSVFGGGTWPGIQRNSWQQPTDSGNNIWPPVDPAIESAYAVWLYQKNTGDTTFLTTANWTSLVSIYNNYKTAIAAGRIPSYSEMGGLIGFIRLAKSRNDTALANDATTLLNSLMQNQGKQFTTIRTYLSSKMRPSLHGWIEATFANIQPEIGVYMRDVVLTDASSYLDTMTNQKNIPGWYQAWAEAQGFYANSQGAFGGPGLLGENSYYLPIISHSIFNGKAYVQKSSQSELTRYLDVPWTLGDLYYVNKVVAAIEAPGGFASASPQASVTISPSPSPSPSPAKPGDIDGDNEVDIFDYNILLTDFGKSGTNLPADIDNSGKVDIFDYNLLLTNFGK